MEVGIKEGKERKGKGGKGKERKGKERKEGKGEPSIRKGKPTIPHRRRRLKKNRKKSNP